MKYSIVIVLLVLAVNAYAVDKNSWSVDVTKDSQFHAASVRSQKYINRIFSIGFPADQGCEPYGSIYTDIEGVPEQETIDFEFRVDQNQIHYITAYAVQDGDGQAAVWPIDQTLLKQIMIGNILRAKVPVTTEYDYDKYALRNSRETIMKAYRNCAAVKEWGGNRAPRQDKDSTYFNDEDVYW